MRKIIYSLLILVIGASFFFMVSPSLFFQDVEEKEKVGKKSKVEKESRALSTSSVSFRTMEVPDYEDKKSPDSKRKSGQSSFAPPKVVRAVYLTASFASSKSQIDRLLNVLRVSSINSVVIDVSASSGEVAYDSAVKKVNDYGTDSRIIKDLEGLVKRLHKNGIYVIARLPVFKDSALAEARPDLTLKSSSSNKIWRDSGGEFWLDPAARDVWEYKVSVAKEVLRLGFDEINFDYIRFPSDGDLEDIDYPVWDEKTSKADVLENFFKYLDGKLEGERLSIDVFGVVLTERGEGVGQALDDVFKYFDVVSPMVYPSHYSPGSFGFENPSLHPYGTVAVALSEGILRSQFSFESKAKIRPWLQDFSLETSYGPEEVKGQIRAVKEVTGDDFAGFMLWSPRNVYSWDALIDARN